MTCSYCGTRNSEGEHRCRRCGRRPDDTLTGEFTLAPTNGALAAQPHRVSADGTGETSARLAPQAVSHSRAAGLRINPRRQPDLSRAVQSSLFQERPNGKVVAIADYAAPARQKSAVAARAATKPPAKPGTKTAARRPRPVVEEQGQLPFLPPQTAKPRTLGTTVDSVIYCDAPVAATLHRLVAAFLDWSMVLIAYGVFALVFHLMGGEFVFNKVNSMVFGSMLLVTAFAYGMTWTLAGGETAGMHWMRLRLTTFDGVPPEPKQRVLRFFGSCLSACTVLGLLWSLADEESLTWQDHISRTFPTPVGVEDQIFRRV